MIVEVSVEQHLWLSGWMNKWSLIVCFAKLLFDSMIWLKEVCFNLVACVSFGEVYDGIRGYDDSR